MRSIPLLIGLQFITLFCNAQSETDQIRSGYHQYQLAVSPEKSAVLQPSFFVVNENTKSQNQLRARVLVVLQNIRDLSLAWTNPKSNVYHSDSARLLLNTSLDVCLNYLKKDNEWSLYQWETIRSVCDIALFLHDDLTPDQLTMCKQFLKGHRLRNTNAVKEPLLSDELEIHFGVLTGDLNSIGNARDRSVATIDFGKHIQRDLSFQHDGRLEVFTPEKSFLLDNLRVAWQLRNTSWKFPREKIILITDVIINSWYLMARGLYTAPGPVGIYSSKENALKVTDLRPYISMMRELCDERTDKLASLELSLNGKKFPEGIYYWPYSDFTAIHENNFSCFIKTSSDRTSTARPQYPENLKGHILGTGDAYLVHDGFEYFNLMPVWNWRHVPGTTSFPKASTTSPQSFAGNVNNGKSSLTAMKFHSLDSLGKQYITGHKFWASHDGMIVSLVGNVHGNISGSAFTTIDQCRWRGDVTVNRPGNILKAGSHKFTDVRWIHHAGFVYITMPFYPTKLDLELKEVKGNWRSVSHSQPEKAVTENVFMPVVDHGHLVDEGYTGFVVVHASTPHEAQSITAKPQWEVMRNNKDCQGVYFKDGTVMAAFFTNNSQLTHENKLTLEVSEPCLILIENNQLFVSSMDATEKKIRIKWNNRIFNVTTTAYSNGTAAMSPEQ
jgi:chondroitin AC lyase